MNQGMLDDTLNRLFEACTTEQRLQGYLVLGVALWTQGLPSYAYHHHGTVATVVGAVGFTWGLVALGVLIDKLRVPPLSMSNRASVPVDTH